MNPELVNELGPNTQREGPNALLVCSGGGASGQSAVGKFSKAQSPIKEHD
jgi:hypothetical protein